MGIAELLATADLVNRADTLPASPIRNRRAAQARVRLLRRTEIVLDEHIAWLERRLRAARRLAAYCGRTADRLIDQLSQ
jgi:hypothetical protein